MKLAYLIAAYQDPELLGRLVRSFQYTDSVYFFIHIDKKQNIQLFKNVCCDKNVFFLEKEQRVAVIWVGYSQMPSMVNLWDTNLRKIFSQRSYDLITHHFSLDSNIGKLKKIYESL